MRLRVLFIMLMHLLAMSLLVLLSGCPAPPEVPVVPPPPEDLSLWTVPELIQPAAPDIAGPPSLAESKPTAAEKVYAYAPGTPYAVQVSVGWPFDVVLEPGEQVRNIVGGDRSPTEARVPTGEGAPSEAPVARRWEVREGAEGQGDTLRSHIFLAASEVGMSTGVIVTTTRRTYLLDVKSVKTSPVRILRWTYSMALGGAPPKAPEPPLLPQTERPARYHVGYRIESQGRAPDWMPRQVLDDGKKLYILYPEVTLFGSVPVVRMVGPNGPQLLNTRQHLNVVIVDQLPARVELRVGIGDTAEVVTLTRGGLRTIDCPEDPDCPHWPGASQGSPRRTP